MKTKKEKQILKNTLKQCLILLLVCFFAFLAVFPVLPKQNNLNYLANSEQVANLNLKTNDDLMFQTPVEDDHWAQTLKNDLNSYSTKSFDLKESIAEPLVVFEDTFKFNKVEVELVSQETSNSWSTLYYDLVWTANFIFESHDGETNQITYDNFCVEASTSYSQSNFSPQYGSVYYSASLKLLAKNQKLIKIFQMKILIFLVKILIFEDFFLIDYLEIEAMEKTKIQ